MIRSLTRLTVSSAVVLMLSLTASPATAATKKPASALPKVGIAAIVNDEAITFNDIENRMRLYMLGAPANLPEAAKQQVLQQATYKLVDERLQMQEARNLNIAVDKKLIDDAFATVAAQNKADPEEFRKRLAQAGVQPSTLEDQIRADLAWSQVVRRKLRPQITISENEIDTEVGRLQRGSGKIEYRVAEIFLSFSGDASEKSAREKADNIAAQIRKGKQFSQLAREFSEAPGAATGGDIGWIEEGILDSKLEGALVALKPGQLSDPVRTDKGFHLLFLRDMRQKGIGATAMPAATPATPAPRPSLVSMDATDMPKPASVESPKVIEGTPAAAPPTTPAPSEVQREEIANRLGSQRLEQMAERYLRDLRATAFIEQRF